MPTLVCIEQDVDVVPISRSVAVLACAPWVSGEPQSAHRVSEQEVQQPQVVGDTAQQDKQVEADQGCLPRVGPSPRGEGPTFLSGTGRRV